MYREARIPLVITYDSDADAAYVHLDHPIAAGSVRSELFDLAQGMFALDIDDAGRVLGLEIIGARAHLPPALLQALTGGATD